MAISSEDLIHIICNKIGIQRDGSGQFLNKQELMLIVAHFEKLEIHIRSLKAEVDTNRDGQALAEAVKAILKQEGLIDG